MLFKKQAYMIALNKAKPVAYIAVFKAQHGLMRGKKKLNKTFCYEGNRGMAQLVLNV